jgi:lactoylglutathione lyase
MLHVADMDRTLAFYCDVLGMEVQVARENKATGHRNVFVGYGPQETHALVEFVSYRDRPAYEHGNGFGHVALGVADCRAACGYFADRGVAVTREPRVAPSGAVIAFVADPDGYQLEIVQSAPAHG